MDNIQTALHKAAAYCSRSEHCISEIEEKLSGWGIEQDDAQKIIKRLINEKFIDQERFCRFYINDKYKYNKWGKLKIAYSLKMKKIDRDMIYNSLEDVIDYDLYTENLEKMMRDKLKSIKEKKWFEISAKLYRFAASRGFENDDISACLSTIKNDINRI